LFQRSSQKLPSDNVNGPWFFIERHGNLLQVVI
jgi:hypothetical protein